MNALRSLLLTVGLALLCALQFVPGVGVGEARAAYIHPPIVCTASKTPLCSREQALAECMASYAAVNAYTPKAGTAPNQYPRAYGDACATWQTWVPGARYGYAERGTANEGPGSPYFYGYATNGGCPAGSTWNSSTSTCFSSAACLARNADLGTLQNADRPSLTVSRCVAGCDFSMQPGYSTYSVPLSGITAYRGVMKYSGNACGAVSPTNPSGEVADQKTPPVQECSPIAGTGVCVRGDGKFCLASVRTGRQFCWRPGETGEKTDFDVMQVRNAGDTPTTPTTLPPAGDTFTPNGAPVVAQITAGGVTITAVTQNYTTSTGASAGGSKPDQGTNSDGSSGPSPGGVGDSGSDGVEGGVTGGADCDNPPQVTGDPVLANVVLQTWGTRCAVESAKSVTSTGEINKCAQPWTISGPDTDANVSKLKAVRAEICGSDEDGNGIGDAYEGTAPTREEGIADGDTNTDGSDAGGPGGGAVVAGQAFGEAVEGGDGSLDFGGWTSWTRTCPTIPDVVLPNGAHIPFSTVALCNIMQTLGVVFLTLASLFAAKVMAGGIE